MNRIFKVKWNALFQHDKMACEIINGQTKLSYQDKKMNLSLMIPISIGGLLFLLSASVSAAVSELVSFEPREGRTVQASTSSAQPRMANSNSITSGDNTAPDDGGNNIYKIATRLVTAYKAGSAAYVSNMAAANTLFTTRLHDRLGETSYIDAITGEEEVTSMWLRNVGGHTRSSDSRGQWKTQSNRYVMQTGGDVAQWSSDGNDRYHLGVMAGYANQHSNSHNKPTGQNAAGSISGYSTGVYGTWLQDNEEKTGAYIDTWVQYSWFNNRVKDGALVAESYKSKGFTTSAEGGYTWKLGEKNEREGYYIQPQAQLTWMGVKTDSIREDYGDRVNGTGDGNIQARLGIRAFLKGHSEIDNGKDRLFEPFVETNWISNTHSFGSRMNDVTVTQKGTRNIGEIKVGVEGKIKADVYVWSNIGQQLAGSGYSDVSAVLGIKASFR